MTALFDAMTDARSNPRVDARLGTPWLLCGAKRVSGGALLVAALGLWLEPGSSYDADILALKTGLSVTLGLGGLALMLRRRSRQSAEIEIDTIRREVRVVRFGPCGRRIVRGTAIRDLGMAEEAGDALRLWSANGTMLAEVPLTAPDMRARLTGALRDEGKL